MSEDNAILVARMQAAVTALPAPEQTVFRLHAVDGLDYAAVAARLGIDLREVEQLLASALLLLARHFSDGDCERESLGNSA